MTRKIISVLFLVATVLGLVNVYGDDTDTRNAAEKLACGAKSCVGLIRAERTPISRNFTFQTQITPTRTQAVECQRSFLLVGEYQCRRPK